MNCFESSIILKPVVNVLFLLTLPFHLAFAMPPGGDGFTGTQTGGYTSPGTWSGQTNITRVHNPVSSPAISTPFIPPPTSISSQLGSIPNSGYSYERITSNQATAQSIATTNQITDHFFTYLPTLDSALSKMMNGPFSYGNGKEQIDDAMRQINAAGNKMIADAQASHDYTYRAILHTPDGLQPISKNSPFYHDFEHSKARLDQARSDLAGLQTKADAAKKVNADNYWKAQIAKHKPLLDEQEKMRKSYQKWLRNNGTNEVEQGRLLDLYHSSDKGREESQRIQHLRLLAHRAKEQLPPLEAPLTPSYPEDAVFIGKAALGATFGAFKGLCFPGETPICVSETESRPIQEIEEGEEVESCHVESGLDLGSCEYRKVKHVIKDNPPVNHLIKIYFGGKTLRTTEEHPFYVVGQEWIEAKRLQINDELVTVDGDTVLIDKIEDEYGTFPVFNLEVEGNNTYYACGVSESNPDDRLGVLVHNCNVGVAALTSQTVRSSASSIAKGSWGYIKAVPSAIRAAPSLIKLGIGYVYKAAQGYWYRNWSADARAVKEEFGPDAVKFARKNIDVVKHIRDIYDYDVKSLKYVMEHMKTSGSSKESIARTLSDMRRGIGYKYKQMTPEVLLNKITTRNLERYKDPLGPTIDSLIQNAKKDGLIGDQIWDKIIQSSQRTNNKLSKLIGILE